MSRARIQYLGVCECDGQAIAPAATRRAQSSLRAFGLRRDLAGDRRVVASDVIGGAGVHVGCGPAARSRATRSSSVEQLGGRRTRTSRRSGARPALARASARSARRARASAPGTVVDDLRSGTAASPRDTRSCRARDVVARVAGARIRNRPIRDRKRARPVVDARCCAASGCRAAMPRSCANASTSATSWTSARDLDARQRPARDSSNSASPFGTSIASHEPMVGEHTAIDDAGDAGMRQRFDRARALEQIGAHRPRARRTSWTSRAGVAMNRRVRAVRERTGHAIRADVIADQHVLALHPRAPYRTLGSRKLGTRLQYCDRHAEWIAILIAGRASTSASSESTAAGSRAKDRSAGSLLRSPDRRSRPATSPSRAASRATSAALGRRAGFGVDMRSTSSTDAERRRVPAARRRSPCRARGRRRALRPDRRAARASSS